MDWDYYDNKQLYDQAIRALDYGEVFEEYEPDIHKNPLELLDEEEAKKVLELAKSQEILNGEKCSIAGMDFLQPE